MQRFASGHVFLFTILLPCHVMLAPLHQWYSDDVVAPQQYGVVVDAGSSGSRSRVYRWWVQGMDHLVPDITELYSYKEKPGISNFADNLPGLEPYVRHLVSMAADNVPKELHNNTVLYFMATAGMRLLLEDKANDVMDEINRLLMKKDLNPFSYMSRNTRILSGEEEGVFAWISLNYLLGFFNRHAVNSAERSVGILEMGGASLQIAFQPEGNILADKFPVKVAGTTYPVYVHSYLNYGQDYADLWIKTYLHDEGVEKKNIQNPCMLKDDALTIKIKGANVTYLGTGDPDECMKLLNLYTYKVEPSRCHPKPCSVGSVYQPSISEDQQFYAVGAIIFPLRTLKVLQPDGTFSLRETNSSAYKYCMKDIETVKNETGRTDDFLSVECLVGLYIPTLFIRSFRFDEDTTQIKAVTKIRGQPSGWTLGAIIYESESRRVKLCNVPSEEAPDVSSASVHLLPSWTLQGVLAFLVVLSHIGNRS